MRILTAQDSVLGLYAMNSLAVKRFVSIYVRVNKVFARKQSDAQKRHAYCNY